MTASVMQQDRKHITEAGFDAYVGKPINLKEFLDAVQPQLIVATSLIFPTRERIPDAWARTVRERGITLFRQDETGAVKLEFFRDHWQASGFMDHAAFRSRIGGDELHALLAGDRHLLDPAIAA